MVVKNILEKRNTHRPPVESVVLKQFSRSVHLCGSGGSYAIEISPSALRRVSRGLQMHESLVGPGWTGVKGRVQG